MSQVVDRMTGPPALRATAAMRPTRTVPPSPISHAAVRPASLADGGLAARLGSNTTRIGLGRHLIRALVLLRRFGPFTLIHLSVLFVFAVRFSWLALVATAFTYLSLLIGSAAWMHRYFSHRSFKTGRVMQAVLAFWGGCASQRGALWWASHHRRHHAFAETEDDPHSPALVNFWHAHFAWVFEDEHQDANVKWVRDLARYPELRFLDRWYWLPPICFWSAAFGLGAAIGAITGAGAIAQGLSLLVWGPVVGTVLAWHATFCINSITHLWGTRDYDTGDDSRNNKWLNVFNLGEGWHNNHHYYPHSANSGFRRGEWDPIFWVILAFEKTGLIWAVKRAPRRVIEGHVKPSKPRPEFPIAEPVVMATVAAAKSRSAPRHEDESGGESGAEEVVVAA